MLVACGPLVIERTVARDTLAAAVFGAGGVDVTSCVPKGGTKVRRGTIDAHDLVLTSNIGYGLRLAGTDGKVERVTVRRTRPGVDTVLGMGVG